MSDEFGVKCCLVWSGVVWCGLVWSGQDSERLISRRRGGEWGKDRRGQGLKGFQGRVRSRLWMELMIEQIASLYIKLSPSRRSMWETSFPFAREYCFGYQFHNIIQYVTCHFELLDLPRRASYHRIALFNQSISFLPKS